MKINKKTLAAVSNTPQNALKRAKRGHIKGKPAIAAQSATKPAKGDKKAKPAKREPVVFDLAKHNAQFTGKAIKAIALLSGKRGHCARSVEQVTLKGGQTAIRALHDNSMLSCKESVFCPIEDGLITASSPKIGRIQLGAYVNGKNTGAKVEIVSQAEFEKRSLPCNVHWKATDDKPIVGRYIGNPNVKGMVAIGVKYAGGYYFWQMEQDSNVNNRHERGIVTALKKGETLAVTK